MANATNNGTPRIPEFRLKEQMCDIGKRIWTKGFCAGNEGNHSYRLGPDRILCTPSLISKGNLNPDDTRLGESIRPFIKESNTILLGNHGVVCYGPDLEDAYYKLEIVDAYARILLLTKQLGSIKPLDGNDMTELLALKSKFGMYDPRTAPGATPEKQVCTGADFISRVRAEVGGKGRMSTPSGGTTSVVAPQSDLRPMTAMETAIGSMIPQNYSEQDVEQLVQ